MRHNVSEFHMKVFINDLNCLESMFSFASFRLYVYIIALPITQKHLTYNVKVAILFGFEMTNEFRNGVI